MKKIISYILIALGAIIIGACSSIPVGTTIPNVEITKVALAQKEQQVGFNVTLKVFYKSAEPLPVEQIKIKVYSQNNILGVFDKSYSDTTIAPNKESYYTLFVPANKLDNIAFQNLKKMKLVTIKVKADAKLIVSTSKKDDLFNSDAQYEGIVGYDI